MLNLDTIFLSNSEISSLKKANRGLSISYDMAFRLEAAAMLTIEECSPKRKLARCEITNEGRRYLDYLNRKRKAHRLESRRYWITTMIAIIALIVAIVSLLQSVSLIDLAQFPTRLWH